MNPRQFKKLCKQAADIIDSKHPLMAKIRFYSRKGEDSPEIFRWYKWERKHLHGYNGRLATEPEAFPSGIAGYGETTGYYEPEWSDKSALCSLFDIVAEEFMDYTNCASGEWPECNMPINIKRSNRELIKFAKYHCFATNYCGV